MPKRDGATGKVPWTNCGGETIDVRILPSKGLFVCGVSSFGPGCRGERARGPVSRGPLAGVDQLELGLPRSPRDS